MSQLATGIPLSEDDQHIVRQNIRAAIRMLGSNDVEGAISYLRPALTKFDPDYTHFPRGITGKSARRFIHDWIGVEDVEGHNLCNVFEFKNDGQVEDFLANVGGAPHPLGGYRVVLAIGD